MDSHRVHLVRNSFSLLRPSAAAVAASFYARLFDADPALRALFHGDLERQGERLMSMIAAAVELLDRPATLLPVLRELGARHVGYGVVESHYASVGAALLSTLADRLGDRFTAEVRDAWGAVYGVVSSTMLEGARLSTVEASANA